MYKYIIFDFNGTLLDDVSVSLGALNYCLHKYVDKNKTISLNSYLDEFSFPVGDYYKKIGFDFNKINYDEVANDFIGYYDERFKDNKLYPNVIKTLKRLKDEGYSLIILTASYVKLIEKQLEFYGIKDYFDDVLAQENKYALSKTQIMLNYLKDHNINANSCIYLGDTSHDIEVAKQCNIKVISFYKGHNSYNKLKKDNDLLVDDINDIFNFLN